jgi:tRNA modification GTPase
VEHQPPHRGRQRAGTPLSSGSRPGAEALAADDTIVAAATPAGRGGIAIVRVSGSRVPQIAAALLGRLPSPRFATAAAFRAADGQPLDRGLALFFPGPHSYTGEHVLELHGHGGPVLVEALIRRVLELGARRAQAGEFTQRAYLNGKLDLAQAEAVASLIDAASEQAAHAALRSLEGELSVRVRQLHEALADVRARVEAAIDFAEEQIEALTTQALTTRLQAIAAELSVLRASSRQGRLLTEGMRVVITGRPNAGKSTLMNRLAGYEAAIVTAVPGTTRDVLRERIVLDGMPLQLLDTAGLRPAGQPLGDAIEAEGIRRAVAAMAGADRILFVVDGSCDPEAAAYREECARLPSGVPVTLIINKADAMAGEPARAGAAGDVTALPLSARTGLGVPALIEHLRASAGMAAPDGGVVSARARHLEALQRASDRLESARRELARRGHPELVAEELRGAQQALGEIISAEGSEELLGRIFESFCIGK